MPDKSRKLSSNFAVELFKISSFAKVEFVEFLPFTEAEFIKFSSFIPYSEKFEILFTKYNKEIKEQDKIKINILGIEEIIGVTKSRYEFYKKLFTNFE